MKFGEPVGGMTLSKDQAPAAARDKRESMVSFWLVVIYLMLEFGRPQSLLPALQSFRLPALTVGLIGLSLLFSGKLHLKDRQTIVYLALLAEMIVHGPIALNNFWAYQVFYAMTVTFIAYLGIIAFVDTEEKFDKLVKFWIMIFIFLAIYGYFNANLHLPKYMRYGIGVGGFIGDANDYCMALNTILPFTIFGVFTAKDTLGKVYFLALICLFLYIIMITESRGGFVGMVTVGIYSWFRSNKKVMLAVMIGIMVAFMLVVAPSSYWDEIRSITKENTEENQYGTGAQRVYSWKLGWKLFKDHPVIGVGQGNYPWRVGEAEEKMGMDWKTRSIRGRAAHSLYFTLLPELGIVGTTLFVLMILFSYADLNKVKKATKLRSGTLQGAREKKIYYYALALEGSIIGYLVSSIFISTLYYPVFWLQAAFVLALRKVAVADGVPGSVPGEVKLKLAAADPR